MIDVVFDAVFKIVSKRITEAMELDDIPRMSVISMRVNRTVTNQYVIKTQAQMINQLCERVDKLRAENKHEHMMNKVYRNKIAGLQKQVIDSGRKGNVNGSDNGEDSCRQEKGTEFFMLNKAVQDEGIIPWPSLDGMEIQGRDGEMSRQRHTAQM